MPEPTEFDLAVASAAYQAREARCIAAAGYPGCSVFAHTSQCWDNFWAGGLPNIVFV